MCPCHRSLHRPLRLFWIAFGRWRPRMARPDDNGGVRIPASILWKICLGTATAFVGLLWWAGGEFVKLSNQADTLRDLAATTAAIDKRMTHVEAQLEALVQISSGKK